MNTINVEAGDMGLVIAFVLMLGGIIKNFTPIKNEWIPLVTWILGGLLYQWLSEGWADPRQWMMALLSVAGATGLHSATRSTTEAIKPAALPLLVIGALLAFGVTGCRSLAPGGPYEGDKVVFQAETTITTSYELVDTFLAWEKENRTTLAKWPEIRQAADAMRVAYPGYHKSAIALLEAYKSNPGGDDAQLQRVLALLRTALLQAANHMANAAGA
jgi:hypothetical protein